MDNFLINDASTTNEDMEGKGTTTLVFESDNLIGYYTLKNTSLIFSPDKKFRGIPAIEIVYFALDKKYQRCGFGSSILQNIIYKTMEYSNKFSNVKVIVLSSLQESIEFYLKNGFQNFNQYLSLLHDECREKTEALFINLMIEE